MFISLIEEFLNLKDFLKCIRILAHRINFSGKNRRTALLPL